jgi:DNA-binding transcriptional ArsR family regulator
MLAPPLWRALPQSARRALSWTHAREHARGLCSRCYSTAIREDALADYDPKRLTTEDVVRELPFMDRRGEGLTREQMAARLGISRKTLQHHLRRAKQEGLLHD